MKYKSPSDCGLSKEHSYLGHFKNSKHIDRGHNSSRIDPYEGGPSENKLKGDEPTLKRADDKLGSIKAQEYWDESVRQHQVGKEVHRQIEEFAKQKKKEFKYRGY